MLRFILASRSPRRHFILKSLGLDFEVIPCDVNEIEDPAKAPQDLALQNACLKSRAIADVCPNDFVIGCDTIVSLNGLIMGKPKTAEANMEMLKILSGCSHQVFSGLCIINRRLKYQFLGYDVTRVEFNTILPEDIAAYVLSANPSDKAGGYGIQELPPGFVRKIDGDVSTVVGFPTQLFLRELKKIDAL